MTQIWTYHPNTNTDMILIKKLKQHHLRHRKNLKSGVYTTSNHENKQTKKKKKENATKMKKEKEKQRKLHKIKNEKDRK